MGWQELYEPHQGQIKSSPPRNEESLVALNWRVSGWEKGQQKGHGGPQPDTGEGQKPPELFEGEHSHQTKIFFSLLTSFKIACRILYLLFILKIRKMCELNEFSTMICGETWGL